jgi:hypothetical protein
VSSVRTIGVGQIRWNKDSILKLTTILERQPLPRNREIALEMGVTLRALGTAMTKLGMSPYRGSKNAERIYQNEAFRVDTRRMRDCLAAKSHSAARAFTTGFAMSAAIPTAKSTSPSASSCEPAIHRGL